MVEDGALRQKARNALRSSKLPNDRPTRVWGGNGFGTSCAICDGPIGADEIGYELEFEAVGEGAKPLECHVHLRCFDAWELERRAHADSPLPASDGDGTILDRERHAYKREST